LARILWVGVWCDVFDYDPRMAHGAGKFALGLAASLVLAQATTVESSDRCVPLPVTRGAAASEQSKTYDRFVTIGSLNIAGNAHVRDVLTGWAGARALDGLLLQEVGDHSHDGASFAMEVANDLGYNFAYAPAERLGDTETQGLAILSRYRLDDVRTFQLQYHSLRFRSRCRVALSASVITNTGPVRLMNVHLDTRINSRERITQLEPLLEMLDDVDGPQIIGGDFNTMNIRWFRTMWPLPFLQRQVAAVRTRLGRNGFQTPFISGRPTFKFLGLPLRLDWLYLKRLEALEWNVDTGRVTDHRGVWARVQPKNDTAKSR
jgi:endonuclease/exonuclease/phosphatase family metal-dependent hydrolase